MIQHCRGGTLPVQQQYLTEYDDFMMLVPFIPFNVRFFDEYKAGISGFHCLDCRGFAISGASDYCQNWMCQQAAQHQELNDILVDGVEMRDVLHYPYYKLSWKGLEKRVLKQQKLLTLHTDRIVALATQLKRAHEFKRLLFYIIGALTICLIFLAINDTHSYLTHNNYCSI